MAFADGKLVITGENATAFIFATYPAPFVSMPCAFVDQVSEGPGFGGKDVIESGGGDWAWARTGCVPEHCVPVKGGGLHFSVGVSVN